jgi:hypothetical protein
LGVALPNPVDLVVVVILLSLVILSNILLTKFLTMLPLLKTLGVSLVDPS